MFGESDTGESPRVASPWEALISYPSSNSGSSSPKSESLSVSSSFRIPKLVPEAEEGNIEYKLQLLSPSPTRFARLCTQLKWRLLEGGGQAYYELGVADSGALIGLTRAEMEETLRTLDGMAGEIGASVIVVREVEVPGDMQVDGKMNAGGLEGTMHKRVEEDRLGDKARQFAGTRGQWESSPSPSTTELSSSPSSSLFTCSDSDLNEGLFLMDPEPELPVDETSDPITQFTIDIEISTVYKPRPHRALRPSTMITPSAKSNSKVKTKMQYVKQRGPVHATSSTEGHTDRQTKSHHRRIARDKRREEKQRALAMLPYTTAATPAAAGAEEAEALVHELEGLHVSVSSSPLTVPTIDITPTSPTALSPSSPDWNLATGKRAGDGFGFEEKCRATGPRLIVEALVVRKMALEEAFLDFGGFALG